MVRFYRSSIATILILAGVGLGVGLGATTAHAGLAGEGQVVIDFDRSIFRTGSDDVRLYHSDSAIGGRVAAGLFQGDAREPASGFAGFNPGVLYRGLDDVLLYCIDLFQTINGGASPTYDVYSLSNDSPNVQPGSDAPGDHPLTRDFDRTLDFLGALNHVLNVPEFGYNVNRGEYSWLNPGDRWLSGAIQVGIWESLYEGAVEDDPADNGGSLINGAGSALVFSVDKSDASRRGNFYVSGLSAPGRTLLETTFGLMDTVGRLDPSKALVLTSDRRQDMIVGDPPLGVPTPAPAALMLAGLILMARRHAGLE